MKMTMAKRLQMAKEYFEKHIPYSKLVVKYGCDKAKVQYYIKLYERYGEDPFSDKQGSRIYTREEKLKAIQTILNGEKSSRQVALDMAVPNPHVVQDWVKKYQEEGEAAIQVSRGRKRYMLHEDRQKFLANQELNEKLEALELENEYLKKSLALISKKDRRSKTK
jgi:transposase